MLHFLLEGFNNYLQSRIRDISLKTLQSVKNHLKLIRRRKIKQKREFYYFQKGDIFTTCFKVECSKSWIILIHFNLKGGWLEILPVSLHHWSKECTLPFICKYLVNLEFHLNNRNTTKRCEICSCSKLTIKTPEGHQWRRSAIFIVNFRTFFLVFLLLLLTLNK